MTDAQPIEEGAVRAPFAALPMREDFKTIALTGSYREYADLLPPPCGLSELEAVKGEILEQLGSTAVMALATQSPEGWTQIHEMHFSTMVDVGHRPVIYSFTHPNTRKVINIPNDARVALSCYKTIGFERRRETRAFYGRGLARMVDDPAEWELAEKAHWMKEGQEYAKLLRVEGQPLIRIDILQGVWFNPTRKPRHCVVDYFDSSTHQGE